VDVVIVAVVPGQILAEVGSIFKMGAGVEAKGGDNFNSQKSAQEPILVATW
jgi:hypothetical protein